jgi:hypothetical protein
MVHITSEQNKEISFQQQHEPVLASRSSPVNLEPSPAESWDFKCAMAKANRNPKPQKKTSKQHDLKSVLAQLARGDVHEVHPCAVGLVDAGVRPEQQRRHERAHERDPLGGVVDAGPGLVHLPYLGPRAPLVRAAPREGRQPRRAAHRRLHLPALRRRAAVHPHGRLGRRERAGELRRERLRRVEGGQQGGGAPGPIHAAVLLRTAGDGGDAAEVRAQGELPEEQVQGLRPHERRRQDAAALGEVPADAAVGAVVRQLGVEVDEVGGDGGEIGIEHRGLERPGMGSEGQWR